MRILGGVLIVLGLLFCLSVIGAIIGIPMIILGIVLAALGGRRTLITNVVSVQTAPATRTDFEPQAPAVLHRASELPREPLQRQPRLEAIEVPATAYDAGKWQVLIRYDDDIRNAVERVRPFGDAYEAELATAYLQVNDKAYLDSVRRKNRPALFCSCSTRSRIARPRYHAEAETIDRFESSSFYISGYRRSGPWCIRRMIGRVPSKRVMPAWHHA